MFNPGSQVDATVSSVKHALASMNADSQGQTQQRYLESTPLRSEPC